MAKDDQHFDKQLQQKLNARIVPAPKELWSSIADGLDQAAEQDAQLDQSLQEQFTSFEHKAPLGLWGAIEGELTSPPALDEDALLDEKVRESYEQPQAAPEQIWYNIDQQLNVDTIWRKMQPGLNHLRKAYLWRKRLRQLSMAAVFLLLIRGCGLHILPDFNQQPITVEVNQQAIPAKSKEYHSTSKQAANSSQEETNSQQTIASPTTKQLLPKSLKTIEKTKAENNPLSTEQRPQAKVIGENDQHSSPSPSTDNSIAKVVHDNKVMKEAIAEKILSQSPIPAMSANALAREEKAAIVELTKMVQPSSNKFKAYQEIGLIASLQHSLILNDATPKSLRLQSASAVRKEILPAASYGLNINHYFHPKQALAFELWWNSSIRHKYNYAYRGKQLGAEVKLRYVKAALVYELNVLDYSFLKSQQKLLLRVGAYVANLQEQSQLSSPYQTNLPLPELQDWDSGLLFGLEQKHQLHPRLSFAYGFRTEIGITSILEVSKANNKRPSFLNVGGIARLNYRL